jgi:catechol 2,3-dioxygenase-like lactoylglutathione lyase family enzyme
VNFELQLVGVPVSDVDRAIAFYTEQAGFHLDVDVTVREGLRFVQLTPPGSACSICMGVGIIDEMAPGSLRNLQLVVTDIGQARAELAGRGMEVSEVDVQPWGSFVYFRDPDGNAWSVQQLPPRG